MKKTLKVILSVTAALLLGLIVVVQTVLMLPKQFDEVYFGELTTKYQRLRNIQEPKVVVISGSSVAFGVNSALMEQQLGMPVVNFGLYGPLGTTIMMDLTRGHINEGDIIILAPETDEQTMSMYFNGEAFWECCDSDFTMLFKLRGDKIGEMIGSFWDYAAQKLDFYRYGKPQPNDVYNSSSFDNRGDMIFTRNKVNMDDWYDTEVLIDLDTGIIEQEFIDYVNEYVAYCEARGAKVYMSFPPMNILAVKQDYNERLAYATFLRENFDCELISNIDDYILYPGYFYDTNYHVNDRGVPVHTANLTQDILNVLGRPSPVDILRQPPLTRANPTSLEPSYEPEAEEEVVEEEVVEETVPEQPEEKGSSQHAEYFLTEPCDTGLRIIGTTEAAKSMTELEIPWEIGGVKVTELGSNAFSGCQKLTTIHIQGNLSRILNNAFDGAPALSSIRIYTEGGNILVPGKDLFENVPSRAKIQVTKEYYGSFIADYFWGNYRDRIEMYTG